MMQFTEKIFAEDIERSDFPFIPDIHNSPVLGEMLDSTYLNSFGLKKEDIIFHNLFNDEPKLRRISIQQKTPIDTDGHTPYTSVFSAGKSFNAVSALRGALGEYLERLLLLRYWEKDLLESTVGQVKKDDSFLLDREPLLNLNQDENFLWARGKVFSSRENMLIPAQFIFLNYNLDHGSWKETALRESNSNGAAAHPSLEGAILHGVYEVIERHNLIHFWSKKLTPKRISLESVYDLSIKNILEYCDSYRLRVHFLNLSEIQIPTIGCFVEDLSGIGPAVSFGCSTHGSWNQAMRGALEEALASRLRIRDMFNIRNLNFSLKNLPKEMFSKADTRVAYWSLYENQKKIDSFIRGSYIEMTSLINTSFDVNPEKEIERIQDTLFLTSKKRAILYYQSGKMKLPFNMEVVKVVIPDTYHFCVRSELGFIPGAEDENMLPIPLS